ncbi:hypothetical protein [Jiella marina]|uniref:hypothetical protein n=1 Tax=Jiella sp. LLJ827 TaxID=2917712 RepID=UPI0021008BBA|nr:hypothetical protein [Jiella sp. LLJ827]MCQ0987227.1 hypothetical protein [Jiella sp. LLJ827]
MENPIIEIDEPQIFPKNDSRPYINALKLIALDIGEDDEFLCYLLGMAIQYLEESGSPTCNH